MLELGQVLAGPFCGALLAWFGAEVIKVEPPGGGDPLRTWRHIEDGTSLWWYILGRNKKSITADLRQETGRDLIRRLIARSDVVIENFRPGRMEEWGLGPEDIATRSTRARSSRACPATARPGPTRRSRATRRWPKATAACATSPASRIGRRRAPT